MGVEPRSQRRVAAALKWFQVDSDTPNDPRIRAVTRELSAAGMGGLFLIWCYIADHGAKPGRSIDSTGRPFPIEDLREISKLEQAEFDRLITICVESGHFRKNAWLKRKEIAIPAMERRSDTYTRRTNSGVLSKAKYGKSGMTRLEIFERDDFRCQYCGKKRTVSCLEVDHRIPVFRGGTDDPSNLATACKSCNRKKGHDELDVNGKKVPSTLLVVSS